MAPKDSRLATWTCAACVATFLSASPQAIVRQGGGGSAGVFYEGGKTPQVACRFENLKGKGFPEMLEDKLLLAIQPGRARFSIVLNAPARQFGLSRDRVQLVSLAPGTPFPQVQEVPIRATVDTRDPNKLAIEVDRNLGSGQYQFVKLDGTIVIFFGCGFRVSET